MPRPAPLKPVPTFKSPDLYLSLTATTADGLTPRTPHSALRNRASPSPRNPKRKKQREPKGPAVLELDDVDLDSPDAVRQRLLPHSHDSAGRGSLESARSNDSRASYMGSPPPGSPISKRFTISIAAIFAVVVIGLFGVSIFAPQILGTDPNLSPKVVQHPGSVPDSQAPAGEVALGETIAHPPSSDNAPPHDMNHDHPASNFHSISYQNYTSFPLTALEYAGECWTEHNRQAEHGHAHGAFWAEPHEIVDVPEHQSDVDGSICEESITYLLDGSTSGLVAELNVLAQVAGLARERRKPFFVIDSQWNRGSWLDYFESVPSHDSQTHQPNCRPPPPEELVACPRSVKHWLVTFRTAKFHLTHEFYNEFEDPHARSVHRQRPMYDRAVNSFTSIIRPNARVQALIDQARYELLPHASSPSPSRSKTELKVTKSDDAPFGSYIAVHMRQGDAHPKNLRYGMKAIPVLSHVEGISKAITDFKFAIPTGSSSNAPFVVYAASDSAQALDELTRLAEKESTVSPSGKKWDVVSLRTSKSFELRELAYPAELGYVQDDWSFPGPTSNGAGVIDRGEMRGRWTSEEVMRYSTGMLVDLALLSGLWQDHNAGAKAAVLPGAAVCGYTSTICTTSALGMGFDHAFAADRGRRWIDLDGRGSYEPVWQAFKLAW
ncbi:hypothetical protein DL93DRAFT_2086299 [Clavulina sp. PMI_390]|nr:hypothetical protein DL93DRAFT_2086299 [Clavulina sp. PMI_390]